MFSFYFSLTQHHYAHSRNSGNYIRLASAFTVVQCTCRSLHRIIRYTCLTCTLCLPILTAKFSARVGSGTETREEKRNERGRKTNQRIHLRVHFRSVTTATTSPAIMLFVIFAWPNNHSTVCNTVKEEESLTSAVDKKKEERKYCEGLLCHCLQT